MRLYVGNLAEHATEQCIHDLFDKFGMHECNVMKSNNKAFAIIHVEKGEQAIAELDGKLVQGSVLKVSKAVDRTKQCING